MSPRCKRSAVAHADMVVVTFDGHIVATGQAKRVTARGTRGSNLVDVEPLR